MKFSARALKTGLSRGLWLALGLSITAPALAQNTQGRFLDVIVRLNDSFSPGRGATGKAAATDIARSLGVNPSHAYGSVTFGFSGQITEGRLTALRNDPRVQNVRLTRTATTAERITAKPDCSVDPTHKSCGGDTGGSGGSQVTSWGYDRIGAGSTSKTGQGVDVFVFDTGIDSDHPDLQANLTAPHLAVETCKVVSFPFISDCDASKQLWDDDHSHGTHVSGIIDAIDNDIGIIGVAPEAKLHAVKVLDWSGSGSDAGIIDGINWLVNLIDTNQIAAPVVVNMSLRTPNVSKQGTCTDTGYTPNPGTTGDIYHEAFCNAANAGVVFVVAAGNDDVDAATVVPAAYDDAVITVSATMRNRIGRGKNKTEVDDWPSWSNWGDGEPDSLLVTGPVAIAAPGDNILSLMNDGGTGTKSGTSMASPFVAGAVAAYLQGTTLNPLNGYGWFQEVRNIFMTGAEETSGWNNSSGNPHNEDFLDANQN